MGWIEAAVRYAGVFSSREKAAYRSVFGVSEPSMSRHQAKFAKRFEVACGAEVFQRENFGAFTGGKLILIDGAALPKRHVFDTPSLDRWLEDAMGPRFTKPQSALRVDPDPAVLREIVGAITAMSVLEIDYLSRSGRSRRPISPHTIVDVADRYHVRAYDHTKNRFADFVLSRIDRILKPKSGRLRYIENSLDADWHTQCEIVISSRSTPIQDGVVRDFKLDKLGQRIISDRLAIAPYLCDDPGEGYLSPVRISMRSDG